MGISFLPLRRLKICPELSREYSSQPIGPYDLQIAAQAVAPDVVLITGNAGEHGREPDL